LLQNMLILICDIIASAFRMTESEQCFIVFMRIYAESLDHPMEEPRLTQLLTRLIDLIANIELDGSLTIYTETI
jgi:hypothetical protein